jgi:membrane-associated phospholipid phosphatase
MQQNILSKYRIYSVLCCIYFIAGGFFLLNLQKGDEILLFDAHRTTFGNFFFLYITRYGEEIPFILAFLFFLTQKQYSKAIGIPLLVLLVTTTSYLLKTYFAQARPGSFFKSIGQLEKMNLVDGVQLNMGMTSFPSGHTLSAFAISTFLVLTIPANNLWSVVFFLLASLVAVSRIYLVQHFFVDVYFGATVGILLGCLMAYLVHRNQHLLKSKSLIQKQVP